jgi:conjugal transfer pilus assembly protein TraW
MKLPLLSMLLLGAFSMFADANEIKVGDVYPVKEKSMEALLAKRIQSADMEQTLLNYTKTFEAGITIPAAAVDREYPFTPWYVLQEDIRDHNNQVLFPKGFRFNPLTKIRAPGRLVFFDETQVDWVIKNALAGDHLVMTSGDVYTAMEKLKARVYLLDAKTHERLNVSAVPSTYEQKVNEFHFTVNQYAF